MWIMASANKTGFYRAENQFKCWLNCWDSIIEFTFESFKTFTTKYEIGLRCSEYQKHLNRGISSTKLFQFHLDIFLYLSQSVVIVEKFYYHNNGIIFSLSSFSRSQWSIIIFIFVSYHVIRYFSSICLG